MTRFRRLIVRMLWASLIGIPLLLIGTYWLNPLGAQSWDPRERITGFGVYRTPSSSMQPTFAPGQILITRAGHAGVRHLQRGDVIVRKVPEEVGQLWLQRIVGLPGETVSIVEGRLHIDGVPVAEPYLDPDNIRTPYSRTLSPVRVPPEHYFMLGDNRDNSADSRMMAMARRQDIIARVIARFQ